MTIKNIFDFLFALVLLLLLGWFILLCMLVAGFDTASNGLFIQKRIGQYGKPFPIFKMRTMHTQTSEISRVGSYLRKSKIDELPQLVNILFGHMSFVGPRPDVPGYYDQLEREARKLLELKPGLCSRAALKYFNEEKLLAQQPNPQHYNDEVLFPDKVKLNLDYYYNHSFLEDLRILWACLVRKQ